MHIPVPRQQKQTGETCRRVRPRERPERARATRRIWHTVASEMKHGDAAFGEATGEEEEKEEAGADAIPVVVRVVRVPPPPAKRARTGGAAAPRRPPRPGGEGREAPAGLGVYGDPGEHLCTIETGRGRGGGGESVGEGEGDSEGGTNDDEWCAFNYFPLIQRIVTCPAPPQVNAYAHERDPGAAPAEAERGAGASDAVGRAVMQQTVIEINDDDDGDDDDDDDEGEKSVGAHSSHGGANESTAEPEVIEIDDDADDDDDGDDDGDDDDDSGGGGGNSAVGGGEPAKEQEVIEIDDDDDDDESDGGDGGNPGEQRKEPASNKRGSLSRDPPSAAFAGSRGASAPYHALQTKKCGICREKHPEFRYSGKQWSRLDGHCSKCGVMERHRRVQQGEFRTGRTTREKNKSAKKSSRTCEAQCYKVLYSKKEEQERLFREAAARARERLAQEQRRTASAAGAYSAASAPTFDRPVDDVRTLPDYHWTWLDPFARLGLHPNASIAQIKRHFRRLALSYHPDKAQCTNAPARFQAIKEARSECLTKLGGYS